MYQILIYADSLSWGIIPDTRERFVFDPIVQAKPDFQLYQTVIW